MAANRARQPPPGLRGNAYPEAINRTLVFFGVTYTPVFANIAMEIPPFLDVFSIGKNWWISLISIAMAMFYWYGYIKSKKNEQKITEQNPTSWWFGIIDVFPWRRNSQPAASSRRGVVWIKLLGSVSTDWWKPAHFPPNGGFE